MLTRFTLDAMSSPFPIEGVMAFSDSVPARQGEARDKCGQFLALDGAVMQQRFGDRVEPLPIPPDQPANTCMRSYRIAGFV